MARWPSFLPVRLLLWFSLTWAQSGTQSKISKETKEISVLPWMFCVKVNRNWNNAEKSVDNVNLLSFIEDKRNRPTGNGWSSSSLRLFFCFFSSCCCCFAFLRACCPQNTRERDLGDLGEFWLFFFSILVKCRHFTVRQRVLAMSSFVVSTTPTDTQPPHVSQCGDR